MPRLKLNCVSKRGPGYSSRHFAKLSELNAFDLTNIYTPNGNTHDQTFQ